MLNQAILVGFRAFKWCFLGHKLFSRLDERAFEAALQPHLSRFEAPRRFIMAVGPSKDDVAAF